MIGAQPGICPIARGAPISIDSAVRTPSASAEQRRSKRRRHDTDLEGDRLRGRGGAGERSPPPHAQQNIEKLKQFKVSGTDLNIPPVPQTGKNADAIRENLKRVKLPPGFKIDLYAIVPDARHMAVAPSTNMLFVGTRKTTVWAVTDRNSDYVADEVKPFAPSLKFQVPNGVCWTKDGFLIVVEHNRILNFPAAEFFYEGPDVAVIEVVPQGQLIPVEEESFNHGARVCRVGPDKMLYVAARPAVQRAAARQARPVQASRASAASSA